MPKEFVTQNDKKIAFSQDRLEFYKVLVELETSGHSDPRVIHFHTVLSDLLKNKRVYEDGSFLLRYMAKKGLLEKHSIQKGYFYESTYYTLVDSEFINSVFIKNSLDLPALSHLTLIERKLINNVENITSDQNLYETYRRDRDPCLIL